MGLCRGSIGLLRGILGVSTIDQVVADFDVDFLRLLLSMP